MLCEMHEPPGRLFTADHSFVQIDNELMFSRSAGADLRDSPWVADESGRMNAAGLNEATRLCEQVLSLPDTVFQEALRMPEEYNPRMVWSSAQEDRSHSTSRTGFPESGRLIRRGTVVVEAVVLAALFPATLAVDALRACRSRPPASVGSGTADVNFCACERRTGSGGRVGLRLLDCIAIDA